MQEAWDKNGKLYYVDDKGNRVQPNQTYNPFEKLQRKAQANLENVKSFINNSDTNSQSYKDKINLALGLITAPMGGSSLLASKGATALTPLVGKNIGKAISSSAIGGATGSGVAGFGRGLVEDKNPLLTMVSDGTLGLLFGGAFGLAGGKIGKKLAEKALAKGNIASQKYFDDYVAGLAESDTLGKASPFSKEFGKFRGLQQGLTPKYTEIALDQIPHNEFDEWFNGSKIIDNEGKPLLFRDDDNVFITDGYSNNGISRFSYKGNHRAPSSTVTEGTPEYRSENSFDMNLNEVLQGLSPQPDDYFSANGPRWYGYDDAEGLESLNAIRRVQNGAKDIVAYRAVPNNVNSNVLNNGDWITFSKKYAKVHGDSNLDGDYRIIEQKVSPNDVWWDGNDIREWGYDNGLPQNPEIMLQIKNPYRQALLPENWKDARAIRNKGYDGIITDDGKYLVFEKNQIKRTSDIENYDSLFNKIMAQEPITQEEIKPTAPIPPYKESNFYKQRMQRRSARQLSEEDNALYNKIMNTSKELKAPKPIEKSLKKEGEIVIMEGSNPFSEGEINYAITEITSNMSPEEKAKGYAVRKLGNEYTHLKYDKNGKHKMGKFDVNERLYDENR